MNEVKVRLLTERNIENGRIVQVYEVGSYEVAVRGRKDSPVARTFVEIQRMSGNNGRYLPFLYVYDREDENDNILMDIHVETTS